MAARVRQVVWAESARNALDEVIEYIAQDSQSRAIELLEDASGWGELGYVLRAWAYRSRVE